MRRIKKYLFLLGCLAPVLSFAQKIDNTVSFRDINSEKYFRLHYDNDFFSGTDYYYTQGYNFELVHPALKKNPLTITLIQLKDGWKKYGISFEHFGFTPTSIRSDEIIYNDRPFASAIMLKTFSISIDPINKTRLSSVLSTGVIGQAAFGGKMQATIHRWIDGVKPAGWQHQVRNDVVINYELGHEKQLYAYSNFFSFNTYTQIRVGTLMNRAQAGFTITLGKNHSPFTNHENKTGNNFKIYIYNQPLLSFVGYDATLQGGMLNRQSPYTLSADEITRVNFQNNFGAVLQLKRLYLEYYQSILTKEFNTGMYHRWGGIRLGLRI